jgi:hypothetical protein
MNRKEVEQESWGDYALFLCLKQKPVCLEDREREEGRREGRREKQREREREEKVRMRERR